MEKKFKMLPPMMPNFISYETSARPMNKLPITDLSEDEAEAYGELMKQTFIKHWYTKTKLLEHGK